MESYITIGLIAVILMTISIGILIYRVVKRIPKKLRFDVVSLFLIGCILVIISFVKSPNFHALERDDDGKPHGILNPLRDKSVTTPIVEEESKPEITETKSMTYTDEDIEAIIREDITRLDPYADDNTLLCDDYDIHVEDLMKYDNLRHLIKGKYIVEEIGSLNPEEVPEQYRDLLPNPYYIKTKATDNGIVVSAYGNMFSYKDSIPEVGELVKFKGFIMEKMVQGIAVESDYTVILLGGFR